MKGALFIVILSVVLIVLLLESRKPVQEPFQNKASPSLVVPKTRPDPATLYAGSPQPFAPPTTALLAPPPGQTASVNSYVYEDPALKKADGKRIQAALLSVKGFLQNEAPGLQTLGDPSIVLPLGTARADAQRLEDEANVLARNPGLQSSLTDADLNMIEANLGFLQRKWRMSANSVGSVEGFQSDVPGSPAPSGPMSSVGYLQQWFGNPSRNLFQEELTAAQKGAIASGTSVSTSTPVALASLQELKTMIVQITSRIQSITNSGTQDDVLLTRVEALKDVKKRVQVLIDKIEITKTMKESEIPITKSQYTAFMAALVGGTELPALTTDTTKEAPETGTTLQSVFGALGPDGLKNISFDWDIKLRYTGDTERTLTEEAIKAAANAALPGARNTTLTTYGPGDETVERGGYRGAFDSIIQYLTGKGSSDIVKSVKTEKENGSVPTIKGTMASSGAPATLDWKEKSKDICEQIKKREMDPYEFGCMKDTTTVSENFSYRGYAKMICSRLATHYDPSIPELCGCPPVSWPGWRP